MTCRDQTAEVKRIAASYPPEAKHTPRWEREAYLTDLQQLAWLIRFEPEAATCPDFEQSRHSVDKAPPGPRA